MWIINKDTEKWSSNTEALPVSDFESLKQDLKSLRFYQRILSGATFVRIDNTEDIYSILNYHKNVSINYKSNLSSYVNPYTLPITNEEQILSTESLRDFQDKFLPEYGYTLKNLFTPQRLINDQAKNIVYVDVATTAILDNLGQKIPNFTIDEVKLKEGHRVLVKDQYVFVTIPSSVDPDNYFPGYYESFQEIGSNTTYKVFDSTNGIYIYKDSTLVRTTDLDNYQNLINYSICVKLGTINRELQFSLQRLKSGRFPEYQNSEPLYFTERHNWILRNRVDYNNLFELVLYDTLKHGTQSIVYDDITYTIPERAITIGEFGTIFVFQEGKTSIVNCKYKSNLRRIIETPKHYWICGDDGLLFKIKKHNLEITKIELKELLAPPKPGVPRDPRIYRDEGTVVTTLNSITFYNELQGVVVGKFNQIWYTYDSGQTWKRINLVDFDGFNFNVVVYKDINRFYVGGDNGVFIEFYDELGNWTAFKRRISKFVDEDDEYLLVDDITDIKYFSSTYSISATFSDFMAISARNNNFYLYDINKSLSSFTFLNIGGYTFSDISSIEYSTQSQNLYFSTFDNIYRINPFEDQSIGSVSNIITPNFYQYYTQSGVNSLFNYANTELYATGLNSLWIKNNFTGSFSSVYNTEFFDNLKPRLMFMDYEAGSRLYWFDDYGQYRLPGRFKIPVSYLIDSSSSNETFLQFGQNSYELYNPSTSLTYSILENNWITYWKDRLKTFEYYTHLSDIYKVEPSFTFKSSDTFSGTFTYSVSDITTNYSDISALMPNTTSKYRELTVGLTHSNATYNLFFYKWLGIWAIYLAPGFSGNIPEKGDVLHINCNIFSGTFIVNKVYVGNNGTFDIYYLYFFTDFNENILNNLAQLTGSIEITNLNKYPTLTGGIKSFTANYPSGYAQGSYVNIPSYSSGGRLATFDVEVNGAGNITSILVNESGFDYQVGDVVYISTSQISGPTDIQFFVTQLDFNSLFIQNFKKHYISKAYDIEVVTEDYPKPESSPIGVTQSFQITGKYSQFSAYYNLQANVQILNTSGALIEDNILYQSSFLNFGYTPTYNLLSYLNYINPQKFGPEKEFLALPQYVNLPGPDSGVADTLIANDNLIYIDFIQGTYSGKYESNKLYFGINLKPLWDSLMLHTFVDVDITLGTTYPPLGGETVITTKRLLIIDKYLDGGSTDESGLFGNTYNSPYYVLVFHDDFGGTNANVAAVNIKSRRSLQLISDDLQYMNRLQRPYQDSEGTLWSVSNIESGYSYTNYETNINFKIFTDSYTKALLSDANITEELSGIVYTDYKGELALQVIKLENQLEKSVSILQSGNNKYILSFSTFHNLSNGDGVVVELANGGTFSNWPKLLGYHIITYIDPFAVELDIPWEGFVPGDSLKVSYIKKDPFMNFEPVDIFDLGVGDKKVKQSVQILPTNYDVSGTTYFLKNMDYSKYRFKLIDGLDLVRLTQDFYWILDAEVSEAIIGMDSNQNLIWYKGIWEGGRWFGGTWISGTWKSGDWYEGVWTSRVITDKALSVDFDTKNTSLYASNWYGGRWFGGTWENGTWFNGRWYGGTWNDGRWFDGTWNDGIWNAGVFSGGTWVLGTWNSGKFNTNNSLSYWLDGRFLGGDFENGIWYNGEFSQNSEIESRFGTRSFNTRNSIWHGGKFLNGQFHSFLNIDDVGNVASSEIHKYSTWYSGLFTGGVFYGGNVYHMNCNSAVWFGGILNEIDIIGIKSNSIYNHFVLDGIYRLNINDTFYVVDKYVGGTYSVFGTTDLPKKYKVLDTTIDEENKRTEVYVDIELQDILSVNTGIISDSGIKFVSIFKDSTWESGLWFNGVFESGYFNGGIWYHGNFSGTWG
jgi:hypothetical protein